VVINRNIHYVDNNGNTDLVYEVTNLPTEWAFKTTDNDNETDEVKHGIKRITPGKINHGHSFKNWDAQMVIF
jgi:hypothetical protein